jgi:hypothetical protein
MNAQQAVEINNKQQDLIQKRGVYSKIYQAITRVDGGVVALLEEAIKTNG